MRIAITSQNFKTITGHAGKTRRFLIYETDSQCQPTEVDRIDLPAEMSLHAYHGEDHPLFLARLDALITQGAGQGFVQRLNRQGIRVFVTSESDPVQAASRVAAGVALAPGLPHDHEHHDGHEPGHGHGQGHDHGQNRNLGQVHLAGPGQPALFVQPKGA